MSELMVIPDVVVDRLRRYFKPDAVPRIINAAAALFDGESPLQWVRDGGTWEEVLWRYDQHFSYASTA